MSRRQNSLLFSAHNVYGISHLHPTTHEHLKESIQVLFLYRRSPNYHCGPFTQTAHYHCVPMAPVLSSFLFTHLAFVGHAFNFKYFNYGCGANRPLPLLWCTYIPCHCFISAIMSSICLCREWHIQYIKLDKVRSI